MLYEAFTGGAAAAGESELEEVERELQVCVGARVMLFLVFSRFCRESELEDVARQLMR